MDIELPVLRTLTSFLERATSNADAFSAHFSPDFLERVDSLGREKYVKTVVAIQSMEVATIDAPGPYEVNVTLKSQDVVFRLSAAVEDVAPNRFTRLSISRLKPGVDHGLYPVELRGNRVLVRELGPNDAEGLHKILSNPDVTEHTPWPLSVIPDEARRWIAAISTNAQKVGRDSYNLALADIETDELIGGGGLFVEDKSPGERTINYYVRQELWGQGLATEAAKLMLEFGFSQLNLHRITATVDPNNHASIRVLEKIGMQREGLLRGKYEVKGEWKDRLLYAVVEGGPSIS